ncbi:MAG: hypothetical protein JO023_05880 [Chloroflexi bacterium]|nr:hypothetical protein [Chloroflexota bacterium]
MSKPTKDQPRNERRPLAGERRPDPAAADQTDRVAPLDAGEKELDDASREAVEEELAEESGPFTPGPATYAPLGGAPMPIDNDPRRQRDL